MVEKSRWMQWVPGGVVIIIIAWLFVVGGNTEDVGGQGHSAIAWMIGRWSWPGLDMSHGWLIPLVSVYAVWRKWGEIRAAPCTYGRGGLVLVVCALLLYLIGLRVQQTRLVLLSLPALLWGLSWFLFGWHVARLLAFSCWYLVFCIPFTFLDALTLPLRLLSTLVSDVVLNGLGIPVTRVGTAIHIHSGAGFSLDVAHPCSGLRYLVAMVALTTAYAHFTQSGMGRRTVLCLASIPLAMVGNMVRIILIALVGVVFGTKIAVGFYHDYSGYVVFAVAILLMIAVGNWLQRLTRGVPREKE